MDSGYSLFSMWPKSFAAFSIFHTQLHTTHMTNETHVVVYAIQAWAVNERRDIQETQSLEQKNTQ